MDVELSFISQVWALLPLIPMFYEAVRGGGFWSTDVSMCDREGEAVLEMAVFTNSDYHPSHPFTLIKERRKKETKE